jgi:hypothetical protein
VLISVRARVDPGATVRREGSGRLKYPVTSSGVEPQATTLPRASLCSIQALPLLGEATPHGKHTAPQLQIRICRNSLQKAVALYCEDYTTRRNEHRSFNDALSSYSDAVAKLGQGTVA